MDELEKELKEGFLQESVELLESTEQAFLQLEGDRTNADLLNKIFRFAHNLKGTSRAVGFGQVAEFTHEMENLILRLKEGKLEVTGPVVTLLLECNDHISKMIYGLRDNLDATFESSELLTKIHAALSGTLVETHQIEPAVEEEHTSSEVIVEDVLPDVAGIPSSDLFQEEEPSQMNSAALESLRELGIDLEQTQVVVAEPEKAPAVIAAAPPAQVVAEGKKAVTEETLRVSVSKVSKLNDLVGELVIVQTVLEQMRYTSIQNELAIKAIGQLNKLSKEIQAMSMGLCLVPVKSTFQKMTRIVRDTSKALGKQVNLVIEGEETEIDKTVLEHIGDPLVHIVRNAVDHGLESTEERIKAGKPAEGVIKIRAYHEGNSLAIEVTDDGKGIDHHIIRRKAIEKKVITESQNLSEKELINLIFHAGFSTKDQVSEVSGRGVGMDVVKNNITRLNGSVDVSTTVGKGSVFKICLPLTMAIIEGMIIQVGKESFVIPLDQVTESMLIKKDAVTSFTGVGDCMNLRGKVYPLFKVSQKLSLKDQKSDLSEQIAIIVNSQKEHYAVVVDDIIRQQQVVIKKIGDEVRNQKGFMGSTILGDGKPAFILDIKELFSSDHKNTAKKVA